jgi:hypothetical protein
VEAKNPNAAKLVNLLLNMIAASAPIMQFNKERGEKGRKRNPGSLPVGHVKQNEQLTRARVQPKNV